MVRIVSLLQSMSLYHSMVLSDTIWGRQDPHRSLAFITCTFRVDRDSKSLYILEQSCN